MHFNSTFTLLTIVIILICGCLGPGYDSGEHERYTGQGVEADALVRRRKLCVERDSRRRANRADSVRSLLRDGRFSPMVTVPPAADNWEAEFLEAFNPIAHLEKDGIVVFTDSKGVPHVLAVVVEKIDGMASRRQSLCLESADLTATALLTECSRRLSSKNPAGKDRSDCRGVFHLTQRRFIDPDSKAVYVAVVSGAHDD